MGWISELCVGSAGHETSPHYAGPHDTLRREGRTTLSARAAAIWLCAAVGPALTSCRSTLETQKVKSMTLKRIALFFRMVVRRSGHACAKVPPHALHVWLTASKRCLDRAPPPVPPHRHSCPCPSAPATCRRRASPRLCLPLCTLRLLKSAVTASLR